MHTLTMTMTKTESEREKKEQCTSQNIKIVKNKNAKKRQTTRKKPFAASRESTVFFFSFLEKHSECWSLKGSKSMAKGEAEKQLRKDRR